VAAEYGMTWDHSKDWKNGIHQVVNIGSKKRYQKYRKQQVRKVWEAVERLSRLPPKAKKQVAYGQIPPILTYGSELYTEPSQEQTQLAREYASGRGGVAAAKRPKKYQRPESWKQRCGGKQ